MPASNLDLAAEADPDTVASKSCVDVGAIATGMLTMSLCNDQRCGRSVVYSLRL